jgi:hypothetical protein
MGLGFEFRTSHLQSRHSTASAILLVYFGDRVLVNYLPVLALNLDPSDLSLPGS